MKLNNKGFALSTIMYMILVMAVILISLTLSLLSNRKLILDKIKNESKEYVYGIKEELPVIPNGLPDEYVRLNYIESTGTQYIDTEFIPDQNTKIEMKAMVIGDQANQNFFCSRAGYTTNTFTTFKIGNTFRFDYKSSQTSTGQILNLNTEYTLVADSNKLFVNGVEYIKHIEQTFEAGGPLWLLASYLPNQNPDNLALMKLYYTKVWDNGNLVRDLVPSYKKDTDEVGLYDLVEGKFYGNAGTGEFASGPHSNIEQYNISINANGITFFGDETILKNSVAQLKISPKSNYKLPNIIQVQGADYIYDSSTGIINLSNPKKNIVINVNGVRTVYNAGDIVYFDVIKGVGCLKDEYELSWESDFNSYSTNTRGGDYANSFAGYNGLANRRNFDNQNSCLKFYSLTTDDSLLNNNLTLILDHNTTASVAWNSKKYPNQKHPTTSDGPLTVLAQLKNDTDGWTGLPSRNDSYVYYGKNKNNAKQQYTVDYSGYKARLIEPTEIANITGNSSFVAYSKAKFYFDTNTATADAGINSKGKSNFDWLYDRTANNCESQGCSNNSDVDYYGYWTAVAASEYSYMPWCISSSGSLIYSNIDSSNQYGVRPVITVSKLALQ